MANPNGATNSNAAATGGGGIWVDVRRQVIAAIVAGLIAGFVAAIGVVWAFLEKFIGSFGLVPKDAVVAFVGECPSQGWDDYSDGIGKFIVGAGAGGKLITGGGAVEL